MLLFYILRLFLRTFICSFFSITLGLLATKAPSLYLFFSLEKNIGAYLVFLFYQITYIIPIAITTASLLATVLTVRKLQESQEWQALRFSGLSLATIFTPFFFSSILFVSFCFFSIELATQAKSHRKNFLSSAKKQSPIASLQWQKQPDLSILWQKNFGGSTCILGVHKNREFLFLADRKKEKNSLDFSTISCLFFRCKQGFPEIEIDHYKNFCSRVSYFSLLEKSRYQPRCTTFANLWYQKLSLSYKECLQEIHRRISLCLAPLTLTLVGFFIMATHTKKQEKKYILLFFLFLLFFGVYFCAKIAKNSLYLSIFLFWINHLFLLGCSFFSYYKQGCR